MCFWQSAAWSVICAKLLPAHHLSDDSIGCRKTGNRLIATMAALCWAC